MEVSRGDSNFYDFDKYRKNQQTTPLKGFLPLILTPPEDIIADKTQPVEDYRNSTRCKEDDNKINASKNGQITSFETMERFYHNYFHRDWKIFRDIDLESALPADAHIQIQIHHNGTANTLSITICRLLLLEVKDSQQHTDGFNCHQKFVKYPFIVLRLLPFHNRYHIKIIECPNDNKVGVTNPYNFIDHEEAVYYDIFQTLTFPNITQESLKGHIVDCSVWVATCFPEDNPNLENDKPKTALKSIADKIADKKQCRHVISFFVGMRKITFENFKLLDNRRFWLNLYIPNL